MMLLLLLASCCLFPPALAAGELLLVPSCSCCWRGAAGSLLPQSRSELEEHSTAQFRGQPDRTTVQGAPHAHIRRRHVRAHRARGRVHGRGAWAVGMHGFRTARSDSVEPDEDVSPRSPWRR